MTLGPVLVTVLPPSTANVSAVPNGAEAAWALEANAAAISITTTKSPVAQTRVRQFRVCFGGLSSRFPSVCGGRALGRAGFHR